MYLIIALMAHFDTSNFSRYCKHIL